MKTAVMIQAHKNSKYICLLAKKNPDVNFYIHVDKKSKPTFDEISIQNISNITLLKERVNVYWGGYSQVIATLKLLSSALKNPNNQYFHFISGECFPIKSFNEIEQEWNASPENNYIESYINKKTNWRLKVSIPFTDTIFFRTFFGKLLNKIIKLSSYILKTSKIPTKNYYYGSSWFSINRRLAEFIIYISHSTDFFDMFKKTPCCDEHAFQILVRSFNIKNIVNNNKRFVIFNGKANPEYLSIKKVYEIKKSQNYWFIRKLDEDLLLFLLKNND
ncbi:beta-1,6-N-acetylglucosaminyltransferase [Providencia hangzhouensis]|uniref:beta-1,6-N-acetylglucosaminyltransferase n=1 Tax=Providencia hangzhouensis TaxID=3031799 RepID=UPI003D7E7E8A